MLRDASGECYDPHPESETAREVRGLKEQAAALQANTDVGSQRKLQEVLAQLRDMTGEQPRPSLNATQGGPAARTGTLVVTAYRQINGYYCGPAAQTILRFLGPQTSVAYDPYYGGYPTLTGDRYHDQPILANFFWLATDHYGGTNWGTPYMPFTLNTWRGSNWYVKAPVAGFDGGTMTKTTAWTYIDLDMANGYPVAENVRYDLGDSYIPAGFDPSGDYAHWDVIRGNYLSGGTQYVRIVQVYASPGYTYVPYQNINWNQHWDALAVHHGLVW